MKTRTRSIIPCVKRLLCPAFLFFFLFLSQGFAQDREYQWEIGPGIFALGDNLAKISINDEYAFLNGNDTKELMDSMGNPPSDSEVGLIVPRVNPPPWFLVFEYFPVGYIRDDEKDRLDSDAILKSIRKGTEQANELRKEKGFPSLNVLGWQEKPHYDPESHNLVWAMLAESQGEKVINYNVRVLGRGGYMSVVLVTDPNTLEASRQQLAGVLSGFSYLQGNRYAEYTQGDRLAKIGLTALVAGGAATVAAKTGILKLLAKNIKFVVLGLMALLGGFWRKLKGVFGSE